MRTRTKLVGLFALAIFGFAASDLIAQMEVLNPTSLDVTAGDLAAGNVELLANSDDMDVSIRRSNSSVQAVVEFEVSAISPFENLSVLEFDFESSVFARGEVTQTISLFNYETGVFEELDSRNAQQFVDLTVTVVPTGDPSRFVEPGTSQVSAKIRYQASVQRMQFVVNADHLVWLVTNAEPTIVPLFDDATILEPDTTEDTPEALITRLGDRVRDRHAREGMFQAYDHYLSFYWEERTVSIEIVDRVAKGGSDITINTKSLIPLGTRDFRVFYRGINTVAEYHHNVGMNSLGGNQYTTTITANWKENRPLQIGDRMEFEFSPFLAAPMNGRTNYYGTAVLYVVGEGIVPWEAAGPLLDSYPMPETAWLGGRTTLHYQYSDEPEHLFKQMAGNIAPVSAQPFVLGRRSHHTDFGNGAHSEQPNPAYSEQVGKLGPKFIARSCVACHVNNGRALPPAVGAPMFQTVVKVGSDANGSPHPTLGSVLQPQSTAGSPEATATIASYTNTDGQYGDGEAYSLRQPNYSFTGTTPSHFSVRITPPLVGLGLLEAVDESTIIALADPDDVDADGISGRIRTTTDPETGQPRLGRFTFKGGQARLSHQVAGAFNTDMGVTTSVFPLLDGETEAGPQELDDVDLDELTRYIATLGVGGRRDLDDPQALVGEQLFASAGCVACHTPMLTTSSYHPFAELRNQTIQPYSDLLLHDMGPGLADNMGEQNATGAEWRTTPLWSIGHTADVSGGESYLHDGRARNLNEAILWHGGEAEAAKEAFRTMPATDRAALIKFLKSL